MQNHSLFAHLATRFSTHPENLATESLNYLLSRSSVASQALTSFLELPGLSLGRDLRFRTQVYGEDQAIPDLVGINMNGWPVVIAEAKFWAGLTDHQPVTYLSRLPEEFDSMLVFIAPASRLPSLWAELLRRCREAGLVVSQEATVETEFFLASLGGRRRLALTSWTRLLAFMLRALEAEGQRDLAADLVQLQGLCMQMDTEAFLPLRSEELTGNTGTRVYQFCELVGAVKDECVAAGFASVKGFRSGSGPGWYGPYWRLSGVVSLLFFSSHEWSRTRPTPLWLLLADEMGAWRPSKAIQQALAPLERETPSRLIWDTRGWLVPLGLPLAVERDRVIDAVVAQIRQIADLLTALGPLPGTGGAGAEEGKDRDNDTVAGEPAR